MTVPHYIITALELWFSQGEHMENPLFLTAYLCFCQWHFTLVSLFIWTTTIFQMAIMVRLQLVLTSWFHIAGNKTEWQPRGCLYVLYIHHPHAHHVYCTSIWMHIDPLYRRASLAQTTQETIPFTTEAFSVYGFLLMCSLAFLRSASSLGRLLGENRLCLLRHTSKRALLRKGKVLREPADCIPIMHCCLLDRTTLANIECSECGHHAGLDKALVWLDTGLEDLISFGCFLPWSNTSPAAGGPIYSNPAHDDETEPKNTFTHS